MLNFFLFIPLMISKFQEFHGSLLYHGKKCFYTLIFSASAWALYIVCVLKINKDQLGLKHNNYFL